MNAFLRQTKKEKLQFLLVVGIFLTAIIISFVLRHKTEDLTTTGSDENKLLVQAVNVKPETIEVKIKKTGTVQARNYVGIVPEVSGRVVSLGENFKAGSSFAADEILFQIDPVDYKLMLDRATSNLKRAETELQLAEAEAASAKAEWQSFNPKKKIPDLVARIPQLEQAKANLRSAEAEVESAKLDLDRASFSLPYVGQVVAANVEVGQYLRAGTEYGRIYNQAAIEILVPIEKEYVSWFQPRVSLANITYDQLGTKKEIKGVIERVSADLDAQTRFAKIFITPKDQEERLLPGTFVELELIGPKLEGLWKIPNSSIQDAENVWLVNKDNKLEKFTPVIFSIQDQYTIVKGTGRNAKLVTSMLVGAANGMSVKVVEEGDV